MRTFDDYAREHNIHDDSPTYGIGKHAWDAALAAPAPDNALAALFDGVGPSAYFHVTVSKEEAQTIAAALRAREREKIIPMRTIWINGKRMEVQAYRLSYGLVIELARENSGATIVYHCPFPKPGGVLAKDETVELVEGMRFTCMHTGNA